MAASTALVVDDDPDMRRLVRLTLELAGGFDVEDAADPFHALELWHLRRHDVVVTDHRMPGVTGLELAGVLLDEQPEQLVIICTAFMDTHTVNRAHELGVRAVIPRDQI